MPFLAAVGAGTALFGAYNSYNQSREAGKARDEERRRNAIFDSSRAEYLKKLQNFEQNPSAFFNSDAQKAKIDFGLSSLDRKLSATGAVGSGAEKAALFDYAGRTNADDFNRERDRLSGLSGLTQYNPANNFSNGLSGIKQQGMYDQNFANNLAGFATAGQQMYNNWGSSNTPNGTPPVDNYGSQLPTDESASLGYL
jgi:hypothetical protein